MSYIVLRILYGIALVLLGCIHTVLNVPCVGTEFAGPSDVNTVSVQSPDPNDTNTTNLFANSLYTIPCCGLLTSWNVAAEGAGLIRLQVWRQVSGTDNQVIFLGTNGWEKTTSGVRIISRTIPTNTQIKVNSGDFLSIYHFGTAMVRYDTCDPGISTPDVCSESVYRAPDIPGSEINPGYTYTFNTLQSAYLGVSTIRTYAFKAILSAKSQVTCLNETISISDTLTTGSLVTTVPAVNVDTHTSGSVFTIDSMVPTVPITINSQTGDITTTDILTPNYPSSTYVISIHVTDVCGQSDSCILTLIVTNDPQPVAFENLPGSVEVLHAPDVSFHIYTVQLSRQRELDDVTCEIQSTSPVLNHVTFAIQNTSKTEYSVIMVTDDSLTQPDVTSVTLTVYCWNNQGLNNQSTLTLVFIPGIGSENRFWIIGFLMAFIIICILVAMGVILCVTQGMRRKMPDESPIRRKSTQIKPDVIPAPIYVEPARRSFSPPYKPPSKQREPRDQASPPTTYTGYETSPIGSSGSDVTPVSITSIGWVESPDEEGRKQQFMSPRKSSNFFTFNYQTNSKTRYFRKKPWKP